ncbi:MAG: three-Cys-motif partner protein TcmP [Rhodospirillales bacterium]|nr:three-Cys-motif partner protein TcmP [Rhodospirillales bacterium]
MPWTLPDPASYKGREQTYVKHVFLDRYLERVALVTLASGGWSGFVYVDGYSGPWQAQGEKSEDTSVSIALTKLNIVRQALQKIGKETQTSALFVERNPSAFTELQKLLESFPDSRTQSINGEFHRHISDVVKFIGAAFSLTFTHTSLTRRFLSHLPSGPTSIWCTRRDIGGAWRSSGK